MEKPNNLENQDSSTEIIDILIEYLSHWKLFAILISICLCIGIVTYLTKKNQYKISSSVLLKETPATSSSLNGLEAMGLISTTNNVDNEISTFRSPDLMKQVVQTLEIQTSYLINNRFRKIDIYKDSPYYVRLEDVSSDFFSDRIELTLKRTGGKVELEGNYFTLDKTIAFNGSLETLPTLFKLPEELGRLYISKTDVKDKDSEVYYVHIKGVESVASELATKLEIEPATKSSSVLAISTTVSNEKKGKDILSALVKKYNEDNVKENNQTAFNTSIFINERLKDISIELGSVEKDVEAYKQAEGITDLSSETQLYMQQVGLNEQRKLDIETQLNVINLIDSYIRNAENANKPIPNLGINDPGLVTSITTYNSKLL